MSLNMMLPVVIGASIAGSLAARIAVESAFAFSLIPRAKGKPPDRRRHAIFISNIFTHPISFIAVTLGLSGHWDLLIWSPLLEIVWAIVKAVLLVRATRETLRSIYTACFADAASYLVAVFVGLTIAGLLG